MESNKIKVGKRSQNMIQEVFMLKNIEHPNIIKCYQSFVEDNYLYIVMEYAEEGDLLKKIERQKTSKRFFAEKDLWEMAWQMWLGLLHMHSNNLIHRDFKAMNVLCKNKTLKIADLGESKFLNTTNFIKSKIVGTPLFLSPEVIKNENYDHRVDIWALGWVMYHLAALEPPFSSDSMEGLLKSIQYKSPKPLQGWYSMKLKDFIYKMLEKQKSKRPFITELFELFPSSYTLTRQVDINNYKSLKSGEEIIQKKNAIDTGKYYIDSEFNAMKNRQLERKSVNPHYPFKNSDYSINKFDIQNTFQQMFEDKHEGRDIAYKLPKFLKDK